MAKIYRIFFKNLLLQNQPAKFYQTWYKLSWVKGIQVCSNKGPGPLHRGDNHKNVKMGWGSFKNLLQNHWANFNQNRKISSLGGGDSNLFK
jgi:hypothetical protein